MAFPSNQFAGQMPEADGDEMMNHLKEYNVEFDLVMAKVSVLTVYCNLTIRRIDFVGKNWYFSNFWIFFCELG